LTLKDTRNGTNVEENTNESRYSGLSRLERDAAVSKQNREHGQKRDSHYGQYWHLNTDRQKANYGQEEVRETIRELQLLVDEHRTPNQNCNYILGELWERHPCPTLWEAKEWNRELIGIIKGMNSEGSINLERRAWAPIINVPYKINLAEPMAFKQQTDIRPKIEANNEASVYTYGSIIPSLLFGGGSGLVAFYGLNQASIENAADLSLFFAFGMSTLELMMSSEKRIEEQEPTRPSYIYTHTRKDDIEDENNVNTMMETFTESNILTAGLFGLVAATGTFCGANEAGATFQEGLTYAATGGIGTMSLCMLLQAQELMMKGLRKTTLHIQKRSSYRTTTEVLEQTRINQVYKKLNTKFESLQENIWESKNYKTFRDFWNTDLD